MHKGSCLCGAIRFEISCPLPSPDACHCSECRKFSGHFFVSTDIPRSALTVHGDDHVTWHAIDGVRRGFCSTCGSSLFWDPIGRNWTAVALGAFDGPTGTKISKHIFVSHKGDYYDLIDELPKHSTVPQTSPTQ